MSNHQAIIPSYQFNCCGNVTEWMVDVHPVRLGEHRWTSSTLNLQIWRPSPTEESARDTGVYSLADNERISPISLSAGRVLVISTPGKHAQFRPGDVLGFYLEDTMDNDRGVVVLNSDTFTSEMVWYASVAPQEGSCLSIGSSGELNTMTRAAPVMSMATGKFLLK